MKSDAFTWVRLSRALMLVGCLIIIPGMAGAQPYNKNYRFFVPAAAEGTVATIDGTTALSGVPDPLWNNAAKFDLDLGASIPAAQMWAVKDGANLYLYFDIEADDFNQRDVLVLGLGNSAGTSYQRLHIFPCKPTGTCPTVATNNHAPTIDYWSGATFSGGAWTWPGATTPLPAAFEARSAFQITTGSSKDRWSLELKIPLAGFSLPATGFFGLYVDVADVTSATGDAWQYPWPPVDAGGVGNIIGGSPGSIVSQLQDGTPSPDKWGMATLNNTAVNGVYISTVTTNHSMSPTLISLLGANRFYALARNEQPGGNLTDALDVSATFFVSGWGAGNVWERIPPSPMNTLTDKPNPTAAHTVPATGSYQFEIGAWTLNASEQARYAVPNDHQCVRVELSSPTALLFNPVKQQNMDFVSTSSPFRRRATVGMAGLKLREGVKDPTLVLRQSFFNTNPKLTWKSEIKLEGKEDRFLVPLRKNDESVSFDVAVEPPQMDMPRKVFTLGARRGKPLQIAVKPGELMTLFAQGTVLMRAKQGKASATGPAGRDFTTDRKLSKAVYRDALGSLAREGRPTRAGAFLLPPAHMPHARMGALVAHWNNSPKKAFFVGQAMTIKVPKGARVLSLDINDIPNAAELRGGEGYAVTVIRSSMQDHFAAANPKVWRDATFDSFELPIGANLPTWIMRAAGRTGKVIVIDGQTFDALEPIGAFGAVVNKIGP